MKKQITFILLLVIYFLFCNMRCDIGDSDLDFNSEELTKVELTNIDFSGVEMVSTNEKIKKEAYVIGVKCFANTYRTNIGEPWHTGELLKSDSFTKNGSSFANTEDKFEIIVLQDFDEEHPAGSNVRDCFKETTAPLWTSKEPFTFVLIMRKFPEPGIYSFKIVYKLKKENEDQQQKTSSEELDVIECVIEPIELY